jgi:hypothetical protein
MSDPTSKTTARAASAGPRCQDPNTELLLMLAEGILKKVRHDLEQAKEKNANLRLYLPWNSPARNITTTDIIDGEAWCTRLANLIQTLKDI